MMDPRLLPPANSLFWPQGSNVTPSPSFASLFSSSGVAQASNEQFPSLHPHYFRQALEEKEEKIRALEEKLKTVEANNSCCLELVVCNSEPSPTNKEAKSKDNVPQVSLPASFIKKTEDEYEARAMVGLFFGPRPPMEALRACQRNHWLSLGCEVVIT